MEFFLIGTNVESAESANQFGNYMQRLTKSLHNGSVKSEIIYLPKYSRVEWSMSLRPKKGAQSEAKIMDDIALAVAEYVVDVREPGIIRRILTKNYELNENEKQAVEAICRKFLTMEEGQAEARKARLMLIEAAFRQMLEGQQSTFDLDGFITFRLHNYGLKLREMVDYAVEEFLLDKQYEDFIELLQYFVHFQEPLTPFIHVMHKRGSEFIILNDRLKQIEASSGDVVMRMADQELQMEDVIVSTLISLSPERILLHTRDPEALAIKTIRRIFGERVQLCLRCPQCKDFHQSTRQRDLVT
ncbi:putative sporulation protein YtxC [Paenibacillus lentus]|uniref:Sporulation protein n=1 Tax=Paenibacillus lentus TaxID=1338368 RepID=A0A3S8RZ53_9BACL|nr:putative sporulation protein YtxC [Paenibacillus lentus]AZK48195.1 sporulation protein [Paenibacillus lentus]